MFDQKYLRRQLGDECELEVVRRQGVLLAERDGRDGAQSELCRFVGKCCAKKGNKEEIAGKLVVIKFYNEQFVGLSMPLGNTLIRSVKQRIKGAHVEKGTHQRVRRRLTWAILTIMQESVPSWG